MATVSSAVDSLKRSLEYELRIVRDRGLRFWIAWKLAQLSFRVKDTTTYSVVSIEYTGSDGPVVSGVIVSGDAWGSGVFVGLRARTEENDSSEESERWVAVVDTDDFDEALDILHRSE